MGQREDDAYRRGRMQGPKNDSTNWLNSPKRTDAEKRAFNRGAVDDLRAKQQRKQASNGAGKHKVKQHTRETPKGKKTRVKQHTRPNQGGSKPKTGGGNGSSNRGTSRPTRRPPTKKKQQQTPLLHPDRSKQYLKKAFNLRTTNGRKATGYAAAALVTGLAWFMVQVIFFGFAALAFIAALAGTLLQEVTE